MKITIKDVANKAGVSIATVSRVISKSKKVDPKTQRKVLDAIKKLNYRPDHIARCLVKGETFTLALLIPPEQNFINADYFHKLIRGVTPSAIKNGYNILIKQQIDELISNIVDFPVDGYIVIAPPLDSFVVKQLEVNHKPAVLINSRSQYLNWIDLDNVSASSSLTNHLIKLGHKKIVFLGGVKNGQNTQDRLEGYQLALSNAGIVFDPGLVFYADYERARAYEIIKRIVSDKLDFTAIFACNDLMAIGAIQALKDKGIRVPDDVSVVGFDDIDLAESFTPPLTTIRQPFSKMGELAVELLIEQLKNKVNEPKHITLEGELIIRKSCK